MAGAKRMSKEEKCKAILDIYHKTKQVYTEKEILTIAAKAGVNANTVADMNDSLVDDALVEKDKIGGSNYFWSFPAKKDRLLQLNHDQTVREIAVLQQQTATASSELADAKRGREDDGTTEGEQSRPAKLARLAALSKERTALEEELESLQENDPHALADLQKELQLVQNAANRWTDNLFNAKSYLVKKRGMDKKEACKILGITANFDYPEDKIPK
mmetsp:Transcript_13594/g.22517  ORF Transcript_13594/g.22517 Transcript_13594/m.22517 type:complete len:216 (-) Transcript_13594:293-940(-)